MALKSLKPRVKTAPSRIKTMQSGSWRTSGMTSAQRGYGYKWQKARERYLRANPLCVYCEREGVIAAASVVDHIEPHQGDMTLFWDESNWQSLCKPHHDSTKQREENELAQSQHGDGG